MRANSLSPVSGDAVPKPLAMSEQLNGRECSGDHQRPANDHQRERHRVTVDDHPGEPETAHRKASQVLQEHDVCGDGWDHPRHGNPQPDMRTQPRSAKVQPLKVQVELPNLTDAGHVRLLSGAAEFLHGDTQLRSDLTRFPGESGIHLEPDHMLGHEPQPTQARKG